MCDSSHVVCHLSGVWQLSVECRHVWIPVKKCQNILKLYFVNSCYEFSLMKLIVPGHLAAAYVKIWRTENWGQTSAYLWFNSETTRSISLSIMWNLLQCIDLLCACFQHFQDNTICIDLVYILIVYDVDFCFDIIDFQ